MSVYPAERGLMRLFRELKIVYLLPVYVVPLHAASCHRSVLFSQEISQSSPEGHLVHCKISACQGVLQTLHVFLAQSLALSCPTKDI